MDIMAMCCGRIHFSELFPTKWSGFIFIAYMALFVNQGLLVTASQKTDSSYHYNTIVAVMAAEVVKLIISCLLYIQDHSLFDLINNSRIHTKVLYHYFAPAFLYCLYNNLSFINLSMFDPTTYFLLLQLRVVVTGVLFQIMFHKQLSAKQWVALVLLTGGCMINQLPLNNYLPSSLTHLLPPNSQSISDNDVIIKYINKDTGNPLNWNIVLILVQVVCSCLAGVYNELLLKGSDTETCNIYIQNVFMYLDSIICNLGLLAWQGQLSALWNSTELESLWDLRVMLVIMNNAAIGIVTSFFLRSMNSILKTFASGLELFFTALMSWLIFGIPIYLNTLCAIIIVSLAVIMYSQNPVINLRLYKEVPKKEVFHV